MNEMKTFLWLNYFSFFLLWFLNSKNKLKWKKENRSERSAKLFECTRFNHIEWSHSNGNNHENEMMVKLEESSSVISKGSVRYDHFEFDERTTKKFSKSWVSIYRVCVFLFFNSYFCFSRRIINNEKKNS